RTVTADVKVSVSSVFVDGPSDKLPSESGVEGQVRRDLPVILKVQADIRQPIGASHIAAGHAGRVDVAEPGSVAALLGRRAGQAEQEIAEREKTHVSSKSHQVVIVVLIAADLSPEPQLMPALQVRKRIRIDECILL